MRFMIARIVVVAYALFGLVEPVFSQAQSPTNPQSSKFGQDWICLPHENEQDDSSLQAKLRSEGRKDVQVSSKNSFVTWTVDDHFIQRVNFERERCASDKTFVSYKVTDEWLQSRPNPISGLKLTHPTKPKRS